jgi:hypothetical protein
MKHWVEVCGVGPWFYADRLPLTAFSYAGKRADDIHVSVARANSGDMQIELVLQRSAHPSMYRDFLAAHPQGGLSAVVRARQHPRPQRRLPLLKAPAHRSL